MYTYEKRKSQKKIMKKVVMNLRNTKICSMFVLPYVFWMLIENKTDNMETIVIEKPVVITDMKKKVRDIQMAISWRDFANTYFQRSSSWFYHKMDGIDGNGGVGGFSKEEAEQMRGALIDLSNRIRRAAENI